ncbi:ABC transporter permease [Rhodococcus sp. NPDC056960]|uniref:ABC transporter permease n=1 Tax=Rhodococcus sp. NPDC056960 TaxID=3345982 RepID=UPI003643DDEA
MTAIAAVPLSTDTVETRRHRRFDPVTIVAGTVLVVLVTAAVIGPWVTPYDPQQVDILASNLPPSAHHLFGTDSLGRDIFSRALAGARLSLIGPVIVVLISSALGTLLALAAAWYGGRLDTALSRVVDVMLAFPSILVAVLAVGIFGVGLAAPVVALTLAYVPYFARIVRATAIREAHLPYVEACQMAGFSTWRINFRHILPAVAPTIGAQATITMGTALVELAAISFIGLGAQPPSSEWGLMVAEGSTALLSGYPYQTIAGGILIVLTVVSVNVLGERAAQRVENRA